ncbi:MAG: CBS domain-containing protein [Flavisolibacter sp.]|jgi:CBS domain-containing protein
MEKVADVLDRKYPQFNTVSPNCLVSDALYQMASENVDHLIVLEDEKFMGILTDHDIASKVLFDERPLKKIPVKEFMNRTLPVATSEDSLEHCMQLMERFNARHLAVYDSFIFKGVVSSHDIIQQALNKRKETFEEKNYVRQGYPWNY